MQRVIYSGLLTLALAACGGGGSENGGDPQPPDPGTNPNLSFHLFGATEVFADSATAFAIIPVNSSSVWETSWQQLSGPTLNIANPSSSVAAFDVQQTGSYVLQYSISNGNFVNTDTVEFVVNQTGGELAILRDHEVVSGGRVSLRAKALDWDDAGAVSQPSNLAWQQIGGPSVADVGNEDPLLYTFTAPEVDSPTLLQFELTGTVFGNTERDSVYVVVQPAAAPVANAYFDTPIAKVQAYRANSPWAEAMERCVYSTQIAHPNPCTVDELPLLGQTSPDPGIEDVMDRVLVSHPWMGEQFETFLREQDSSGDFLKLLSSVTAVVLSYDIRPSFYWVVTGAIYLDPENLWTTDWQRNTINEDPDYRSGFGNALQFLIPWRYVDGNDYASLYYPPHSHWDRPWTQITPDLASLMYHELAHANDYFPRSLHGSISADTLLDEWSQRNQSKSLPSDQLAASYPLASEAMFDLAGVSFHGNSVTPAQQALSPQDVAQLFFDDRASDYYGYSSTREDLAMLFEEAMMQHRYGIRRDVAVSSNRSDDPDQNVIVAQGQRGRIGEAALSPRLDLVLHELFPELAELSQDLPVPIPMTPGLNWWDNLELEPAADQARPAALHSAQPLQGVTHFGPRHAPRTPH
ncbi:hypothetical protein [Ferrimonas pelagia]|uniref:Lipoprotein n=1 Tax=Ferrimonas pelagia TaxID=1177826 RepID=A0ABP9ELL2_9GAMM